MEMQEPAPVMDETTRTQDSSDPIISATNNTQTANAKTDILNLYKNELFPGSGRAITGFYKELVRAKKTHGLSLNEVKTILSRDMAYVSQIPAKVNFPRRQFKPLGVGIELQIDLAEMPLSPTSNNRYIFVAVDIFSQYIYAKAMDNKKSKTSTMTFKQILDENPFPLADNLQYVGTDQGGEFAGDFLIFLNSLGIKLFTFRGKSKAAYAEESIRKIKRPLMTLLRAQHSDAWDKILPAVVLSCNRAWNSTLNRSPEEANSLLVEPEVREAIEQSKERRKKAMQKRYSRIGPEPEFPLGMYVLIDYKRNAMSKESDYQRGTVYKIYAKNSDSEPILYRVEDLSGKKINKAFYGYEMYPALDPNSDEGKQQRHSIERIVAQRGRGSNLEKLVKWVGYPKK